MAKRSWISVKMLSLDASALARAGLELILHSSLHANKRASRRGKPANFGMREVCALPCRLGMTHSHSIEEVGNFLIDNDVYKEVVGVTLKSYLVKLERAGFLEQQQLILNCPPPALMCSVYAELLKRGSTESVFEREDVSLLVLLGLACVGLLGMEFCKLCPRFAIPGGAVCHAHSQASHSKGDCQKFCV